MAQTRKEDFWLPMAAAATLVSDGGPVSLEQSPQGYYKSGHLFCFLPLPDTAVQGQLPVHINATFALTSSRRGLLSISEDDLKSEGGQWNNALLNDAVSRAYLLLLENVHTEAVANTSHFFSIWPVKENILSKGFWSHLVSDGNLVLPNFGEQNIVQWIDFSQAWFLDPEFHSSECGKIAWSSLKKFWVRDGQLVDLPHPVCASIQGSDQRTQFQEKLISELAFYQESFLPNISDTGWNSFERDTLVMSAVLQDDADLNELLKRYPCIPCAELQLLKQPCELIHPEKEASKLYVSTDGRFPQNAKETDTPSKPNLVDFSSHKCLEKLEKLGMITCELPWDMVLERAVSCISLLENSSISARERSRSIIKYLCAPNPMSLVGKFTSFFTGTPTRMKDCPQEIADKLSHTPFLPVLKKPHEKQWPFPWEAEKSEGKTLAAPCELCEGSLKDLVACHKKVLDNECLGLKSPVTSGEEEVLKYLKVRGKYSEKNNKSDKPAVSESPNSHDTIDEEIQADSVEDPTVFTDEKNCKDREELFDITLCQIQTISNFVQSNEGNTQVAQQVLSSIMTNIYSYLKQCLQGGSEKYREKLQQLQYVCVIWVGDRFVEPSRAAFRLNLDCRPYLFKTETSHVVDFRELFESFGVKQSFDVATFASVLTKVHQQYEQRPLPDEDIKRMCHVAQALSESITTENLSVHVFLPDREGIMLPVSSLCLDDCEWLKETDTMKFVNTKVSPDTAKKLGVQSKRKQDYENIGVGIPFGQKEDLTTRIKGLLKGYTFDSSLFKELLQNADDAGATEIKFIKDFRHLGKKSVFQGCEKLQGPALCVFNNKSFTSRDMEGIINLGQGSKGQETLKIGRYGIGFNSVYHLTDVPSFWTREDDTKETICLFDPNCHYLPGCRPDNPGRKVTDVERIRQAYPDMFSGYLGQVIDMTKPGTLFRFPLRTKYMADRSEIKREETNPEQIRKVLDEFKKDIGKCLLFLRNLKQIGVYSVNSDGTLKPEIEVSADLEETSSHNMQTFSQNLAQAATKILDGAVPLNTVNNFEVCTKVTVKSGVTSEEWLCVHMVGFKDNSAVSEALQNEWHKENFRLLPQGGVAVRVAETLNGKHPSIPQPSTNHQAFCVLPLPVHTGLPFHVNGHFALDHETRRNLWDNTGGEQSDAKAEWNNLIASQIIIPAYLSLLQHVQKLWFSSVNQLTPRELSTRLASYHSLFPNLDLSTHFWVTLAKGLYQQIAQLALPFFPAIAVSPDLSLEWMPVASPDAVPGYFSNLEEFYSHVPDKAHADKPVVLSQSGVQSQVASTDNSKWIKKESEELKTLLKNINMKILEAPYSIYTRFKTSGVEVVQLISPDTVYHFLKTANTNISGRCNLHGLPQDVEETPLQNPANAKRLLHFINYGQHLLTNLEGLPLSLRESGRLHCFHVHEHNGKPILSDTFNGLLPGSADLFIHGEIVSLFKKRDYQQWLRKFDVQTLIQLLPDTLPTNEFQRGEPCDYDERKLPDYDERKLPRQKWIKNLWQFIGSKLKKQKDVERIRRATKELLTDLREWSLLPVTRSGHETQLQLFPVKDMHKVLYVSKSPDQSNSEVWNALKSVQLPVLNTTLLPDETFLIHTVASIGHPVALLKALYTCADSLKPSVEVGLSVLRYFSNNVTGLSDEYGDVSKMLRSLPFYPQLDGTLTSVPERRTTLCLDSSVPRAGLVQWALNTRFTLLLKGKVPEQLSDFLGFSAPTAPEFYSRFLLTNFFNLPRSNIVIHMDIIRRCLTTWNPQDQNMVRVQLQETCFIEKEGVLLPANAFYSPHEPVFVAMCLPGEFPHQPYCNLDWKKFMELAGMKCRITPDMFLQYARAVERMGLAGVNPQIEEKCDVLIYHLYHFQESLTSNFLQELRDIRFIRPFQWLEREQNAISKLAEPYQPGRLVSVSESCSESKRYLVWSCTCIRHPDIELHKSNRDSDRTKMIMNHFLGPDSAHYETVLRHILNICRNLEGENGKRILESKLVATKARDVWMKLYKYLNKNLRDEDLHRLRNEAIIYCCDTLLRQMLWPKNIVLDLRQEEGIKGQIEKASPHFREVVDLFKRLGVAERVTADHYARALTCLKEKAGNSELHVEELKLWVKVAVRELFNCLRSDNDNIKKLSVDNLYLPSTSKQLVLSTQLAFVDKPALEKRIKQMPHDMQFCLDFGKLGIDNIITEIELKRLPEKHRLQFLSKLVSESIPNSIKSSAQKGRFSRQAEQMLRNPQFGNVVVRLALKYHRQHNKEFTLEQAEHVIRKISNIAVMEVDSLTTELVWKGNGIVIPDTAQKKKAFVDKLSNSTQCTVYVDKDCCIASGGLRSMPVCKSLRYAVKRVTGLKGISDDYLLLALQNPFEAVQQMDEDGIQSCDFNYTEETSSVFPPPGTFIPVDLHCYLDNTVSTFYDGEHVGYEVYDPQIDENNSVDDNSDDNTPVYIYAIVLREVKEDGEEIPFLEKKYIVDLGPDRGEAQIPVTKLYKFVRGSSRPHATTSSAESTKSAVVPYQGRTGPSTSAAGSERPEFLDFKKVMKEIKEMLTQAWRSLDEKGRNRVVKRLYLKWHPDKNMGNEAFCTRVVQRLQHYVELLKQGKTIPDETDDDDSVDGSSRPQRPSSPNLFNFFEHMHRRSRAHREYFNSHFRGSSGGGGASSGGAGPSFHSSGPSFHDRFRDEDFSSFHFRSYTDETRPNPQPGEGRRWFRQAEADVGAAQDARESCRRGFNWICFQCHQVTSDIF
jgi:sacsin